MTKTYEIYKCDICGNTIEVIEGKGPSLVCCGQNMTKQVENTVDVATEKHVPIIKIEGNKVIIEVGENPHPMEDAHYIELIEVLIDKRVIASYWPKPGEEPKAEFNLSNTSNVSARAYCNIHGLWSSK